MMGEIVTTESHRRRLARENGDAGRSGEDRSLQFDDLVLIQNMTAQLIKSVTQGDGDRIANVCSPCPPESSTRFARTRIEGAKPKAVDIYNVWAEDRQTSAAR